VIAAVLPGRAHGRALGGRAGRARWCGTTPPRPSSFEIHATEEGAAGTYDIPELNLFGEAVNALSASGDVLDLRFKYGHFLGRLNEQAEEITAANGDWGPPGRAPSQAGRLRARPSTCRRRSASGARARCGERSTGRCWRAPHAGVVVITRLRAGGTRTQWEYRGLGPMFARMGVAALVYDKRSEEAPFQTLAEDRRGRARVPGQAPWDRSPPRRVLRHEPGWMAGRRWPPRA
jgi:hypothetical protein